MLESALGARVHDMLEIQSLATAPAKQGRGYASALVRAVNDLVRSLLPPPPSPLRVVARWDWALTRRAQADSLGRAVYVVTTDAYRFYERLGYGLVGEVWIGDANPRWRGPPAAIRLVSTQYLSRPLSARADSFPAVSLPDADGARAAGGFASTTDVTAASIRWARCARVPVGKQTSFVKFVFDPFGFGLYCSHLLLLCIGQAFRI